MSTESNDPGFNMKMFLGQLKVAADNGHIDQVKFDQTRKIKFDMQGAPLPEKDQDEPVFTKISFRQKSAKSK